MKRYFLAALIVGTSLLFGPTTNAAGERFWRVVSPDHEQTFAYGTETNRIWKGWQGHLVLLLNYTNDPFVDRQNPRQYDNFRFDFPAIRSSGDGRTFYYRTPGGHQVPVATKRPDFLGIEEVHLLPNASVIVEKPHGFITVSLEILNGP